MNIEQLNQDYGIADRLKVIEGQGGRPYLQVESALAKATISVYGGQILSFQPAHASEPLLFLSQTALYRDGKAIRGGAPICWPWFGPDPEGLNRSSHGFVRNRMWRILGTELLTDGAIQVTLGVMSDEQTRAIWPYDFELAIAITLSSTLTLELITHNTGTEVFTLSQALHTYLAIGDINQVQVEGLDGKQYIDKVDGGSHKAQTGAVQVRSEVDRIYLDAPATLLIADQAWNRRIHIKSSGSRTAIVWNPWAEVAANMADLGDQDYQRMICVETANAAHDMVEVPPQGKARLQAQYRVE